MLGKKLDVKVVAAIPYAGLYSGYYMVGNRRRNIYLISKDKPRDYVHCTVIAMVQARNSTQTKLIAAPEGQIYYEPLIKKRLRRLRNFRVGRISCLYEKSCGAIVFYRAPDKVKVLLDIRDAIHVLTSIGMNFLVVDERVTVKNYQKTLDAVKEAHDVSDKRWAENE